MAIGAPVTGTATVVLGDVAGSTALWQEHPESMAAASRNLAAMLDRLVEKRGGHRPREQGEGDNLVATFSAASDAVAFALELDAALVTEPWPDDLVIGMRIGIHTGDVEWDAATGYLGPTFNRCARLRDLGHARMILMSQTTHAMVADSLPNDATITDLGEHQLRDLSRAEHAFQIRHAGDDASYPPLKSVSSLPNNLPVPLTTMIGREEEISRIGRLIIDNRLVTLTGAGGSGKTRLAQHVAASLLQYAPDGAWWVDLMPVTDDARVAVAIAEATNVEDVTANAYGTRILMGALRARQALLVIDNCEHVIDAAADIIEEILSSCPEVRILATSRETLDIPGEQGVRVKPLGIPDDDAPSAEQLTDSAATALFLERAAGLEVERLTPTQRTSLANICRRLDGMPLAIELAAARTRMLTIEQIEAGLDDRFSLLSGGRRGRRSGARQRTLEASIAWSFDLLADDERAMLGNLAVFPGAFSLHGAREVGTPESPDAALELLTALVDKSLVTVRTADDARSYKLLESIRAYALAQLHESGGGDAAMHAHLDHALASVKRLDPKPINWDGAFAHAYYLSSALLDDIRAADAWGHSSGRLEDVIDLRWPMVMSETLRGTYYDALVSLAPLLDHPDIDLLHNARLHALVMSYLTSANQHQASLALYERATELANAAPCADPDASAIAHGVDLAALNSQVWSGIDARPLALQTMERARRAVPMVQWTAVGNVGAFASMAFAYAGDEEGAFKIGYEGLEAARAEGLRLQYALTANYLCTYACRAGRPIDEVRALFDQAVEAVPPDAPRFMALLACTAAMMVEAWGGGSFDHWLEIGFASAGPPGTGTHALMTMGQGFAAKFSHDRELAIDSAEAAMRIFSSTDNCWWRSVASWLIAEAKALRGDADALEAVEAAFAEIPDGGLPYMRACVAAAAAFAHAKTDSDRALEFVSDAARLVRDAGTFGTAGMVFASAAQSFTAAGRHADSARVLGAADRFATDRGYVDLYPAQAAAARAAAVAAIGQDAFDAAFEDGATLDVSAACTWLVEL